MAQETLSRVSTAEVAENDYFTNNPPPKDLAQIAELAQQFVAKHLKEGRRIALISSGGTTTVRFIDNFSAGTRGATSAEYFLSCGYAVIFLHRRFSLLPYSRHYSHSTNCFLDFMDQDENGRVYIKEDYQRGMQEVLQMYQHARDNEMLLVLSFTTISEYLWSLRVVSNSLQGIGKNAVFYLAAAVSDFFIPKDRLAEHKIQSSNPAGAPQYSTQGDHASKRGSKLVIDLDPVPKFLKRLVDGWAPDAMVVSFKLETDPSLLISKAKGALEKYSHHLVIGNLLSTRAYEVVLVTPGKETWIKVPEESRTKNATTSSSSFRNLPSVEIEGLIVPQVIGLHDTIVNNVH